MSKIDTTPLIDALAALGEKLLHPDEYLQEFINTECQHNAWFTPQSVLKAVNATGAMLNNTDLEKWLNKYILENRPAKKIGLVLAGNIPLVGFHDVLCVLVSGNQALIKASSQDVRLIKYVLQLLVKIDGSFAGSFSFTERLVSFDAIIATGSNNTSRYFDYYFGKVPNIIRKNRNSAALLTGRETTKQLTALGHDIFDYYGLGCRNVSKLLVPQNYNFNFFFEAIEVYQPVINHHKYSNNYDYNKSIYLVNGDEHLDNGFLLLKQDTRLASPLAVLYFEYYTDIPEIQNLLQTQSKQLQCIVTEVSLAINNQIVDFGNSQQPKLWDYADGIDTMAFLTALS